MTKTPPVLGYATGAAGVIYEEVLVALVDVLGAAGENHWLSWMSDDLASWQERRDTSHHRHAYGGMGSFNDLVIDEPGWLGAAFEQLRHLAGHASRVAGEDADRFIQCPGTGPFSIGFMRCQSCGVRCVSASTIEWAAAMGWASWAVPRLISAGQGSAVLDATLGAEQSDVRQTYVSYIISRLVDLDLTEYQLGPHWETPCPECGEISWYSGSLAIY